MDKIVRSCETCEYYAQETTTLGECRKALPKGIEVNKSLYAGWPRTLKNDWCGEFVRKQEEKEKSSDEQ